MVTLNENFVAVPAASANKPQPPQRRTPVGVVDHWMVGYLPGTDSTFQNPATGYSTNLGIGSVGGRGVDYQVHEYVPVDCVAWGNGNGYLNRVAVSIEHENDRSIGITSKPTHETHELSARVHAALARRFGWRIDGRVQLVYRDFPNHDYYGAASIPGFGTEFNVISHRSVALKDCPAKLDVAWIVKRANELLGPDTSGGGVNRIHLNNRGGMMAGTLIARESGVIAYYTDFDWHETSSWQEVYALGRATGQFPDGFPASDAAVRKVLAEGPWGNMVLSGWEFDLMKARILAARDWYRDQIAGKVAGKVADELRPPAS